MRKKASGVKCWMDTVTGTKPVLPAWMPVRTPRALITIIFCASGLLSGIASEGVFLVCLLLLLYGFPERVRRNGGRVLLWWMLGFVSVFAALFCMQVLRGELSAAQIIRLYGLSKCICAPVLCYWAFVEDAKKPQFIETVVWGVTVMNLLYLVCFFRGSDSVPGLGSENMILGINTVFIPVAGSLLLGQHFDSRPKNHTSLAAVMLLLTGMAELVLASSTTAYLVVAIQGAYLVLNRLARRKLPWFAARTTPWVVAAAFSVVLLIASGVIPLNPLTLGRRVQIWTAAMDYVKASPVLLQWIGTGNDIFTVTAKQLPAHGVIMELWMIYGLIGMGTFVLSATAGVFYLAMNQRNNVFPVCMALLSYLLVCLIHPFYTGVFHFQWICMMGIYYLLGTLGPKPKIPIRRENRNAAVPGWKLNRDRENNLLRVLGNPKDDIQRTAYHYACLNMYSDKSLKAWARKELPALVMTLPALIYLMWNQITSKKGKERCDAVYFCPRQEFLEIMMNDLPPELEEEFPECRTHLQPTEGMLARYRSAHLDGTALRLWLKLVLRYPLEFYMNFYMLLHLGHMCQMVHQYQPRAIISAQTEQDSATSLMTAYAETKGVEYIGIMHGETMRSMTRAYVRFSRFYFWNEQTVRIFLATRSPREMCRLYETKRLNSIYSKREDPEYFLSYYLGAEDEAAMKLLRNHLAPFVSAGLKCKIRPHPRATDMALFTSIFEDSGILMEDPRGVSLKDSVENAEYIVSVCSTVLSEAYMSGLKIVVDDISSYVELEDLRYRMYINLDRADLMLSELIRQVVQ